MSNNYTHYGEPEDPNNFSYPPTSPSDPLPGHCPNPPWMYIKYHPNGARVKYAAPSTVHGIPGLFHRLSSSKGAIMCRSNCIEGSECEVRVKDFFSTAGARVGWRGNTVDDLVWTVIEAIEGGVLDRYGMLTGGYPGEELGYSERYRSGLFRG